MRESSKTTPLILSGVFFVLLCFFVYRSFYGMRIQSGEAATLRMA